MEGRKNSDDKIKTFNMEGRKNSDDKIKTYNMEGRKGSEEKIKKSQHKSEVSEEEVDSFLRSIKAVPTNEEIDSFLQTIKAVPSEEEINKFLTSIKAVDNSGKQMLYADGNKLSFSPPGTSPFAKESIEHLRRASLTDLVEAQTKEREAEEQERKKKLKQEFQNSTRIKVTEEELDSFLRGIKAVPTNEEIEEFLKTIKAIPTEDEINEFLTNIRAQDLSGKPMLYADGNKLSFSPPGTSPFARESVTQFKKHGSVQDLFQLATTQE